VEIQFVHNGEHGGVSIRKNILFVMCPERMPDFCKNYSECLNAECGQWVRQWSLLILFIAVRVVNTAVVSKNGGTRSKYNSS